VRHGSEIGHVEPEEGGDLPGDPLGFGQVLLYRGGIEPITGPAVEVSGDLFAEQARPQVHEVPERMRAALAKSVALEATIFGYQPLLEGRSLVVASPSTICGLFWSSR
jgi:hypothetical protein